MLRRDSSSTPESGSSKIMIFGFTINARAISIRCFCPPDNEKKDLAASCGKPICCRISLTRSSPLLVEIDRDARGHRLPSRRPPMRSEEIADRAPRFVARNQSSITDNCATEFHRQAAVTQDGPKQCCLARTIRTGQTDEAARIDRQVDCLENRR